MSSPTSNQIKNKSQVSGTTLTEALNNLIAGGIPVFTASTSGVVPASGGSNTNFLRADGVWSSIPGVRPLDDDYGDIVVSGAGTVMDVKDIVVNDATKDFIQAGTNISVVYDSFNDKLIINATGSASGESNTASNVGAGAGVFKQKTGVDLEFKTLVAGSKISITPGVSDVTIESTGGDLSGPASSVNNDIAVFDGTTGKLLKDSGVTLAAKQDALVSGTNIKTVNSTSLLGSGDIPVQATLVSGTNIKTINGNSLLGSGDLSLSGTGDVTGPASSVTNQFASFNGTSGKIIKDSGKLAPTGDVVGTVDTQNISNKTFVSNLAFNGTGLRLQGDFTSAPLTNRLMFQTSSVNNSTIVQAIPSGTGTAARWNLANASDPDNASEASFAVTSTLVRLESVIRGTGSYLPMAFFNGGSEGMRLDTSRNFGVGTTAPLSFAKQTIQFEGGGSTSGAMALVAYGASPSVSFRQAAGTLASPAASNTTVINLIGATTNDGTNFFNTIAIQGNVEAASSSGSHPTFVSIATTPSGSTARVERLRVNSSGDILSTGSGGIGYGTGSGGTVTQATSKSTSVTLNKPSGRITMHNAALAAGATVKFTLVSSSIAVTDTVTACGVFVSVDPTNYRVELSRVQSGQAEFRITNLSGGSLSEALEIQYNVHKGATA